MNAKTTPAYGFLLQTPYGVQTKARLYVRRGSMQFELRDCQNQAPDEFQTVRRGGGGAKNIA